MACLSKFLPKALIILLLFLYVMTFLILVSEECSVTNGVKSVWRHSGQAACWGRERDTSPRRKHSQSVDTSPIPKDTLEDMCSSHACMTIIQNKGGGSRSFHWIKIRPHLGDNCDQPLSVTLIHSLINHDLLHSGDSLKHKPATTAERSTAE